MQICCIADTHNVYEYLELSKGDILIHAGDIDAYKYSSELKSFVKWLDLQNFKYKIVIAGNHDGFIYNNPEAREILKGHCIYLENNGVEIEGIKIWGSPITPRFGRWFFMVERGKEIKRYWDMIPKDTNILITHGPSYGILDRTKLFNNVGCMDLRNKIPELKYLKFHIFGHIHEGYGKYKNLKNEKGATFINASVVNEAYELVNEPIIVEYEM